MANKKRKRRMDRGIPRKPRNARKGFAAKVTRLRIRAGLTQEAAEKAWGLPFGVLAGWESGQRTPNKFAQVGYLEHLESMARKKAARPGRRKAEA